MSKEYQFYLDIKYSSWERNKFLIPGDTYEEALERAKKLFETFGFEGSILEPYSDETLDWEQMSPQENDNQPTRELMYKSPQGEEVSVMSNAPEQ